MMRIILEESKVHKKKAASVMGTELISLWKWYVNLYKLVFSLAGHMHSLCSDQRVEDH